MELGRGGMLAGYPAAFSVAQMEEIEPAEEEQ